MKRLVIYYSLSGNTKSAAEKIAENLGADLIQIDFVKPLPKGTAGQMFEGGKQATFGMKPEIKGMPADVSQYDEIIIGTPIWAGKVASPFNTVFTNKDVCEKVVAAFTFSGSGDNAGCISKLMKKLPNLKCNVALADSRTKFAPQNEAKLEKFLEELKA